MNLRSWVSCIPLAFLAVSFVGLPDSASQNKKNDTETKGALAKKQSQFAKAALARLMETKVVDDADFLKCRAKFMTWTGLKGGPDKKSEAWEDFHLAVYDISQRKSVDCKMTITTKKDGKEKTGYIVKFRVSGAKKVERVPGTTRCNKTVPMGFYNIWAEDAGGTPVTSQTDEFPITQKDEPVDLPLK